MKRGERGRVVGEILHQLKGTSPDSPKTSTEIGKEIGKSAHCVRKYVSLMREELLVPIGMDRRGYFLCKTKKSFEKTVLNIERRLAHIKKTTETLLRILNSMERGGKR